MIDSETQARLDWLAAKGIVTSISYGPAEGHGLIWTVNCLTADYQEFGRLQRAHDFDHAVKVAVIHSIRLGFVEGPAP